VRPALTRAAIFEVARRHGFAITFESDGAALLWTGRNTFDFETPAELQGAERADASGEAVLSVHVAGHSVRPVSDLPRVVSEVHALRPRGSGLRPQHDARTDSDTEITSVLVGGKLP
jgi:hypothetical protein